MENKMTTEINKEEEYQFPNQEEYTVESSGKHEDQSTDEVSGHENETDAESVISVNKAGGIIDSLRKISNLPFMKNKRMLVIIGLAFIAIIMVSVLKHHNSNTDSAAQSVATHLTQQNTPPSYSAVQKSALQSKMDNNTNTIQQLNNQINKLNTVVASLQTQQAKLVSLIQPLQTQVTHVNAAVTKMIVAQQKKKHPNRIVYYIKAMIPGRAWLVSKNGVTSSVGAGEKLNGYGKILSINDNDGIVTTASGRNITYGNNDH